MSVFHLLCVIIVMCLQCLHKADTLNSKDNKNLMVGDNTNNMKHSVCITDKEDLISSFYTEIIYDPRSRININDVENPPKLTCKNRTIWISEDSKYVIYYQQFTDSLISAFNNNANLNISGFGIFECSKDSYLTALEHQSADILSSNLCVDPMSIYPDSYPSAQCQGKPLIYCLPFEDKTKCPQFQMTMNSMYNKIDFQKDFTDIFNFYECDCWYKANDEGEINNDQQINININFNENCRQIIKENKLKEQKQYEMYEKNRRQQQNMKQNEYEKDEITYERGKEFSILWACLGFIIGCILLIIIVIYSFRKQYDKKMYLTSRRYYRNAHYGEVENDNLIKNSNDSTHSDTETDGSSYSDSDTGTDLSEELAYQDGDTCTTNCSESIVNYTENTTLHL